MAADVRVKITGHARSANRETTIRSRTRRTIPIDWSSANIAASVVNIQCIGNPNKTKGYCYVNRV